MSENSFLLAKNGQKVRATATNLAQAIAEGYSFTDPKTKVALKTDDGQIVETEGHAAQQAVLDGYQLADDMEVKEAKYGDQNLAALGLGLARGVTFGASDVLARAMGQEEYVKGVQEANPNLSLAGEIGSIAVPIGAPAKLAQWALKAGKAGSAALKASKFGVDMAAKAASAADRASRAVKAADTLALGVRTAQETAIASKAAKEAIRLESKAAMAAASAKRAEKGIELVTRSAIEGTGAGIQQAVSDLALRDHELDAENIMATLGMHALTGGLSGVVGAGALKGLGVAGGIASEKGIQGVKLLANKAQDIMRKAPGLETQSEKLSNLAQKGMQKFSGLSDELMDTVRDMMKNPARRKAAQRAEETFVNDIPKYKKELETTFNTIKQGLNSKVDDLRSQAFIQNAANQESLTAARSTITQEIGEALSRIDADPVFFNEGTKKALQRAQKTLNMEDPAVQRLVRSGKSQLEVEGSTLARARRHLDDAIDYMKLSGPDSEGDAILKGMRSRIDDMAKGNLEGSELMTKADNLYSSWKNDGEAFAKNFIATKRAPDTTKKVTRFLKDAGGEVGQAERKAQAAQFLDWAGKWSDELPDAKGAVLDQLKKIQPVWDMNALRMLDKASGKFTGRSLLPIGFGIAVDMATGLPGASLIATAAAMPVTNPGMYLRMLDGVESTLQKRLLTKGTDWALRKPVTAAGNISDKLTTTIARAKALSEDPGTWEEHVNQLNETASRSVPDMAETVMARAHISGVEIDKNTAMAIATKQQQAAQYLQAIVPSDRTEDDPLGRPRINTIKVDKYLRAARALENPASVFDDFADGHLNREGVQAIMAVYPQVYSQMTQVALQLASIPGAMSHSQKRQLGLLLGAPMLPSLNPRKYQSIQDIWAQNMPLNPDGQPAGQEKPPSGGTGKGSLMKVSKQSQTSMQRLSSG